ncbi:SUKH-4 family immunity protein [Streptomyces smyrnaeus]|uniref:SUKH-4 family immunity protein n=1 Tax=Streptomyces smyrnaeus TaxID=1387713 RepID=UPI0033DCA00C
MISLPVPPRLPGRLYAAFRVVGLEWPDLPLERYAALARAARDAGSRAADTTQARHLAAQARVLETFVRVMGEAEDAFHADLEELTEDHGGPHRVTGHRDCPRAEEVRERRRANAAATVEHAARVRTEHVPLAVQLLERTGALPSAPDYADPEACPWLPGLPAVETHDPPRPLAALTAGRGLAGEALLRWRGDLCGPAVCVVTGASGVGKTRLLAWFTDSSCRDWSGPTAFGAPVREAAISAAGRELPECARALYTQFTGAGRAEPDGLRDEDAPGGPASGGDGGAAPGDPHCRALLAVIVRRGGPVTVTIAGLDACAEPARVADELVRPLAQLPDVRVLVETRDRQLLGHTRHAVLDLDDPRLTERAAFDAWYGAEETTVPGASPFAPAETYPNVGLAAVAARARGPAGARHASSAERVCEAWLDGLGAPARDAAATLSLAQGPMTESVWRLLHCARRPDDPEAAAAAVDAAAACLPTAEPGIPAYELRPGCLAKAAADCLPTSPGGVAAHHREAVAVMAGWPVSERLGPADYVAERLPAHVRLAGLTGPDAVPPREPCRPRVRLTRPVLEEVFGAEGLLRIPSRLLHPRMVHGPTRRFLSEVGIPAGGVSPDFWKDGSSRCRVPLDEDPHWAEVAEELRAVQGLPAPLENLFHLDFLGYGDLLLDGRTGIVHEVDEGLEQVLPAHRDVETYTYLLYRLHRDLRRWRVEAKDAHPDATYWVADNLVLDLRTYDPLPFADPERVWAGHFDDLASGIWSPGTAG